MDKLIMRNMLVCITLYERILEKILTKDQFENLTKEGIYLLLKAYQELSPSSQDASISDYVDKYIEVRNIYNMFTNQ